MGDLNIHTNDPENQDTIPFDDTIKSLGIRNHVTFPTHRLQNTLDIIITTDDSSNFQTLTKAHSFLTIILSTMH